MHYDVTTITVRPGTEHQALSRLKETLPSLMGGELLAVGVPISARSIGSC